jgi:hypothetical protein
MRLCAMAFAALFITSCEQGFDAGGEDGGGGGGGEPGGGNYDGQSGPAKPTCSGQEVTITGTVYAPNGKDPVPGASVIIPSKVPELFSPTVKCEACATFGGTTNWWTATAKYDGTFTLNGVCPGQRVIVIQNGRFRRILQLNIQATGTLKLTASQTRLPTKNAEFHSGDSIPKIAVATGDYDKMECELRKLGLQNGVYDLYEDATYLKAKAAYPAFSTLVSDLTKMKAYNVIFINCTNNTYESQLKTSAVRKNLSDYVQAGGRLYVTDWSYDWIEQVEDFSPFIDFQPSASGSTPEATNAAALGKDGLVVSGNIKDSTMASWLGLFSGAISNGKSTIQHFLAEWVMMYSVSKDVKTWVTGSVQSETGSINATLPLTITFNFKNCGKILYTSYHTEGRDDELQNYPSPPQAFPGYCTTSMSPQDRILEYLIFDIANCVKPFE